MDSESSPLVCFVYDVTDLHVEGPVLRLKAALRGLLWRESLGLDYLCTNYVSTAKLTSLLFAAMYSHCILI